MLLTGMAKTDKKLMQQFEFFADVFKLIERDTLEWTNNPT
jgi:hypothetical protein